MNIKETSLRNIIIVLLVLYQFPVLAQHVVDGGFYAGMNNNGLKSPMNEYDNRWGGQGGFFLKLGNKWTQGETALEYSFRSFKYDQCMIVGSVEDHSYKEQWKMSVISTSHHITLPLSVAVGYWPMTEDNFYEGVGITISGGGYIDIGVAGTTKAKINYAYVESNSVRYDHSPDPVKTDLYGSENHQLRRFDYGWTVGMMFGAGPGFRIGASYRHGLANISNMDGYKMYNKTLFINLMLSFCCFD